MYQQLIIRINSMHPMVGNLENEVKGMLIRAYFSNCRSVKSFAQVAILGLAMSKKNGQ